MEQQIHFGTTHDGVQIAYAMVGQGPPLDTRSEMKRSTSSQVNGEDHFAARIEQGESESSSANAPNLPLVGDGEGSRGYRMLAFVAMLVLAAAALVFLLYLRS